jgi:hypothetical protein
LRTAATKKFGSEFPRPDYPARGADNLPPSKKILTAAATYDLIDRGRRAIPYDS